MQTIQELQARASAPVATMTIEPGFGSLQSFELMQRQAKLLATSSLVPTSYRMVVEKIDYKGNVTSRTENPNAISNCTLALNMAMRMKADPIMVMQNLYLVEGRPSWSSQWIIAQINNCGRFSPLRFEITDLGPMEAEYTTFAWDDKAKAKTPQVRKVKINNKRCVAWVLEKGSDEKLFSPPITIEMAVKEGWYTRNGSKWQTMDDVMLRYRAAALFGKIYAPELLMGFPSAEESEDIQTLEMQEDGSYAPAEPTTVDSLRKQPVSEPSGVVIDQPVEPEKPKPAKQKAEKPDPVKTPEPEPEPKPEPETKTEGEPGKWEPSAAELADIARREQEESGMFGNFE